MRGVPSLTIFVRIEKNLVVYLRAAPPRHLETEADLDAFHGLNAHQRLRQTAVELAVPLGVRTQSRRQTQSHDFENAAERVAFFFALFDQRDHLRFGGAVGGAHGRFFGARVNFVERKPARDSAATPPSERI